MHSTVNNPGTLSVQNRFVLLISFWLCVGFFVLFFVDTWLVSLSTPLNSYLPNLGVGFGGVTWHTAA